MLLLVHLAVTPDGADFDQVVGDLRRAQFKKIPPDRFGREVMANALLCRPMARRPASNAWACTMLNPRKRPCLQRYRTLEVGTQTRPESVGTWRGSRRCSKRSSCVSAHDVPGTPANACARTYRWDVGALGRPGRVFCWVRLDRLDRLGRVLCWAWLWLRRRLLLEQRLGTTLHQG